VVSTSRFESVKSYLQRIQRPTGCTPGPRKDRKLRRRTDAETSEKKGGTRNEARRIVGVVALLALLVAAGRRRR
jgi:MYXO-CTERM domain-containing protein